DALSGEIHPTLTAAMLEDSQSFRTAILDRLRQSNAGSGAESIAPARLGDTRDLGESTAMWVRAFADWDSFDTDRNAASAEGNYSGIAAGADTNVAGTLRVGIAGGYTHSIVSVTGRASRATAGNGHIAGYAGWNGGALALRLGVEY